MLGMAPGVLEEAACAVNFPSATVRDRMEDETDEVPERRDEGGDIGRAGRRRRHADLCIPIKLALSFTGNKNRCLASSCGFKEVSLLEEIHPIVRKLADIYIKQCATSNQALAQTLPERRVTLGERVRIERAFYRFEIFRRAFGSFEGQWSQHAFRELSDKDANRDRDWLDDPVPNFIQEFKECFDTVQLTQLHCIYGFLKRLITPAINDVLWHDFQLQDRSLIGHWATDDRVSANVFMGMEYVYNIWTAFNARRVTQMCNLIQTVVYQPVIGLVEYRISGKHDTVLYHVLAAELYTGRSASLEVTKSKIAIHDTDESPRDACLAVSSAFQAMGQQSPDDLRHEQDSLAPHRQWGFVMWDQRRLDMMGYFTRPDASPALRYPYLSGDLQSTSAMFRQHQDTLKLHFQRYTDPGSIGWNRRLAWWEGVLGGPYTLGGRAYDTWYPLAAPES